MTLQINFELSHADLDHFCEVLKPSHQTANDLSADEIIENTKHLLKQVKRSDARDFIRQAMVKLEVLIAMLKDKSWKMSIEDRQRVLAALSYFSEPSDLIPDDTPGLGFLDDAIMIEIVCRELKHEIQAHGEFIKDCAANNDPESHDPSPEKSTEWLEERRAQLHTRMRRRRREQQDHNRSKSRFSLF